MSGVFDAYAEFYDLLYRDKDYTGEAGWVGDLIRTRRPAAERLLDLGSGTGAHAACFARRGWTVHGVDRSPAMVAGALRRREGLAPDVGGRLGFEVGDVRSWRGGRRFDAVVSLFHVFSYQTTDEDLRAAFATAAAHLDPGGLLVFDFWYGPAVLSRKPEAREKRLSDGELHLLRRANPTLFEDEHRVRVDYEVEIRGPGERRETFRECHDMRYLFLPELRALAGPGLRLAEARAWGSNDLPSEASWSVGAVMERIP